MQRRRFASGASAPAGKTTRRKRPPATTDTAEAVQIIRVCGMLRKEICSWDLDTSITTLDKTKYDPLAKILRKWAKSEHTNKKIPVVSSTEKIINPSSKVLASLNFVPNVAGILCAKYIIDKIVNFNNL